MERSRRISATLFTSRRLRDAHQNIPKFNGLVSRNIYRKAPYLMGKSVVSCRFSLETIHWKMPMVTFRATGSTLGLITALQSTWRNMDCAVSCTSNRWRFHHFFAVSCTMPYPWRIHGAAIYGNMDPINIPPMLVYIPAPWILCHTLQLLCFVRLLAAVRCESCRYKFLRWYDYESWYPLGRPIGTTSAAQFLQWLHQWINHEISWIMIPSGKPT